MKAKYNFKVGYAPEIKDELIKYEWRDGNFTVSFTYTNAKGIQLFCEASIPELWEDWWGERNDCPENDTICYDITIKAVLNNGKSFVLKYDEDFINVTNYSFEDLMCDLGYCLTLETVGFDADTGKDNYDVELHAVFSVNATSYDEAVEKAVAIATTNPDVCWCDELVSSTEL